jgi:hypothetical protein
VSWNIALSIFALFQSLPKYIIDCRMSRHSSVSPGRKLSYDETEANACREFEYRPVPGQLSQSFKIVRKWCETTTWAKSPSSTDSNDYCFVLTPSSGNSLSDVQTQVESDGNDHAGTSVTSAELARIWQTIQNDWALWPGYDDDLRRSVVISRPQELDELDEDDEHTRERTLARAANSIEIARSRMRLAMPPVPYVKRALDVDQNLLAKRRDSQIPPELLESFPDHDGSVVRRVATMTSAGMKYMPQKSSEQQDEAQQPRSSKMSAKIEQ